MLNRRAFLGTVGAVAAAALVPTPAPVPQKLVFHSQSGFKELDGKYYEYRRVPQRFVVEKGQRLQMQPIHDKYEWVEVDKWQS